MNEREMQELRARIVVLVREARARVGSLSARIQEIMGNSERLTPEARRSDVAVILAEGRASIVGLIRDDARSILRGGYAVVDAELTRTTHVVEGELVEAERSLRTVLVAAAQAPDMLLNLYRQRHRNDGERRLIEQTAAAMIDGLGGSDDYAFRNSWNALQQELAAERSPEELAQNTRRSELDALSVYLDAAESVVSADLALMDPASELGDEQRSTVEIRRSMAVAVMEGFELEHAPPAVV